MKTKWKMKWEWVLLATESLGAATIYTHSASVGNGTVIRVVTNCGPRSTSTLTFVPDVTLSEIVYEQKGEA